MRDSFSPPGVERFLGPQQTAFPEALAELSEGKKQGHWMWFVFPQLLGLGHSTLSQYYGIGGMGEARAYLAHPELGSRLRMLCRVLLDSTENDPVAIFGELDAMKLRSSMTLFAAAEGEGSLFHQVLDRFFAGEPDGVTLELLSE